MSGLYIGNPVGVGMVQLPNPPRGYTNPTDRKINTQQLITGGTATTKGRFGRQSFNYAWQWKNATEADTVRGFYTGAWGNGPYVVLDPATRNYLGQDISLMGSRLGSQTGWAAGVGAGTVAYDSTVAPVQLPWGVLRWAGASAATGICAGITVGGITDADPATALPYVATEPYTASIWGRTASGTASCAAGVGGRSYPVGTRTNSPGTSVVLNSSGWQRLTATVSAGFSPSARFVILTVTCNTASAPDILLCAPQLEMASTATTAVVGTGAPRCSVTGTLDSSIEMVVTSRAISLSLVEN